MSAQVGQFSAPREPSPWLAERIADAVTAAQEPVTPLAVTWFAEHDPERFKAMMAVWQESNDEGWQAVLAGVEPVESSLDDDPLGCLRNAAIICAVIVIAVVGPLVFCGWGRSLGLWLGGHI